MGSILAVQLKTEGGEKSDIARWACMLCLVSGSDTVVVPTDGKMSV